MDENTFDLVVIGGGPAGYVGAIRAAQLGLKTACVERERLGGICLNWGCIPTKALLAQAEFYARLKHEAADWGILADNVRHDWSKIIARSRSVADRMNKGIAALFKKNKVTSIAGHGRIVAAGPDCRVEVHDRPDHVARTLSCKYVLVSTGAGPRPLPGAGAGAGAGAPFDGQKIISYRQAMTLPEQPKRLIVIGAGAIGMEFAYFYNAFGTQVTVVEMLDRMLPNEDPEVSAAVARSFRKQDIDCRPGTRVQSVKVTEAGVEVGISSVAGGTPAPPETTPAPAPETLTANKVLVAIGVRGLFDGLLGDNLKLETSRDHIKVDRATYATSLPGVFAAGDVIGPPWLAHVASEEAIVCVEKLAGHHPEPIDYSAIPGCTYCLPQVASLGATEPELQKRGLKAGEGYKVGKFPFQASGKAQALGATEGFVKILTDPRTGEILGVHMVGESVTELLAEMGLAKRLEATSNELIATMHAHPTLSEAIHEAALSGAGRPLHI